MLLEHSHVQACLCCPWLLSCYSGRAELDYVVQEAYNIFYLDLTRKKFPQLFLGHCFSVILDHAIELEISRPCANVLNM